MPRAFQLLCLLSGFCVCATAVADETADVSSRYRALRCPPPQAATTWAILERDGANRQVEPYLSSLAGGESGVGTILSPPFVLEADEIRFTVCGHDGPSGGENLNYLALVDARKGEVLRQTPAPGNDALQERAWDVRDLQGKQVRIEIKDGHRGGAFAWMGVGQIDAGPALRVDFRHGLPEDWNRSEEPIEVQQEYVPGTIPFERRATHLSVIPDQGDVVLPCGFRARRLYFLGCTVPTGLPLETMGAVELHYQSGSVEIIPLMYGFTLEGRSKLRSPSPAMYLAPSSDPFEYVLAVAPADEVLEMIRLVANPGRHPIPHISAITCETDADSPHLAPLPREQVRAEDSAWLDAHTVSQAAPDRLLIEQQLQRSHRLSAPDEGTPVRFAVHQIDAAFRSEGVAVADFDGDGALDIAAGQVLYLGPDWRIQPLLGATPPAYPWKAYSDAFLCFDDDINQDGALDLVVVGFPGQQTYWLENPGARGGTWTRHLAIEQTGNESPAYEDVDGDGRRELVFLHGSRCALARPGEDVTQLWQITEIAGPGDPAEGHGLGVGDMNGDGRLDVLSPAGWWEQPATRGTLPWPFHPAPLFGGAQLCVWDFDGDGRPDVLGSSPHAYGIGWTRQTADGWQTTMIDQSYSQTHALHLADINGDGRMDFVTGKRFWAHNGHDPGSFEPVVLCWYELRPEGDQPRWIKHRIHHDSGVGLHFRIVDLNGDGLLDIVTSNKKGVYWFEQLPR